MSLAHRTLLTKAETVELSGLKDLAAFEAAYKNGYFKACKTSNELILGSSVNEYLSGKYSRPEQSPERLESIEAHRALTKQKAEDKAREDEILKACTARYRLQKQLRQLEKS